MMFTLGGPFIIFLTVLWVCDGQDACRGTRPVMEADKVKKCIDDVTCPDQSSCLDGYCCYDPIILPPRPPPPPPGLTLTCSDGGPPLTDSNGDSIDCSPGGAECPADSMCEQNAICCRVCPMPACLPWCTMTVGADGCPECSCEEDPCKDKKCPDDHTCHVMFPSCIFSAGPCAPEAECVPDTCPDIECTKTCELEENRFGCDVCQCVDPCEEMDCDEGQHCIVHRAVCGGQCPDILPKMAECVDDVMCPAFVCTSPCREEPAPPGKCPKCLCATDICTLDKDVGMCKGLLNRYYFNVKSRQCETFTYGGCGGNDNNFPTLTACQRRCGGVAPPILSPVTVPLPPKLPILPTVTVLLPPKLPILPTVTVPLPPKLPILPIGTIPLPPNPPGLVNDRCVRAVLARPPRCQLDATYKFFYHTRSKKCKRLRNRCSTNSNKFTSKNECESVCEVVRRG